MKKAGRPKAQYQAYRKGVKVAVTLSPKSVVMIDALVATGLFGFHRAGFVQEAVYKHLRELQPDFKFLTTRKPRR
jgi:hypothetical protein